MKYEKTMSRCKGLPSRPKRTKYSHQFIEHLPDNLDDGVLYISVRYATAAHRCFCGCGHEVVTPLHPTKWKLTFDGVTTSLHPSVGSWSLACKSHYWLQDGRIDWADMFTDEQIKAAQSRDLRDQVNYFAPPAIAPVTTAAEKPKKKSVSLVEKLLGWMGVKW